MEISQVANNLLCFLLLLISLTIHQWGHAWMADKLGDPNPRKEGRVSLNPMVHIDLFGTIIFPLICIFFPFGLLFGWGKEVPIHSSYFKHKRLGEILAGGAGLIGNFLLCFIASIVLAFLPNYRMIAYSLLELNAALIVFNLFPMPGLDGFLLFKYAFHLSNETIDFMERWGFFILIVLINIPIVRAFIFASMHFIVVSFLQLSYTFMQLI